MKVAGVMQGTARSSTTGFSTTAARRHVSYFKVSLARTGGVDFTVDMARKVFVGVSVVSTRNFLGVH